MEQERPYTEAEPETAAGTAETITETVVETTEAPAEAAAPKKPREPFFRRQRRELAVALNPVYWIGTSLLMFWCVGQLFDRRPARHSVAAVVLYFLIAVMIGVFAVQELLGA